jgi:hypothetical protein
MMLRKTLERLISTGSLTVIWPDGAKMHFGQVSKDSPHPEIEVDPDAIFVDKVEKDGGKNVSQASLAIKDPTTGKAIGAVTVGIDVDKLK